MNLFGNINQCQNRKIRHWKCTTKPVTQRYALVRSVPGLGLQYGKKRATLKRSSRQGGHFALGQVHWCRGRGEACLPGCRTLCLRGMGRRTAYVIVATYALAIVQLCVSVFNCIYILFYSMWYIVQSCTLPSWFVAYLRGMSPAYVMAACLGNCNCTGACAIAIA